ncbi:MAG TPA: LCP family protein [Actinomycetota bacterium]|nr:LCP family protein [Actinomycetota bacterium]
MIRKATALLAVVASVAVLVPLISSPVSSSPILVGRVHARYQPTDGKVFVAVIGSDARTGNPDNVNADAIHIAGVNTETMRGGVLNFPRDSWVTIPGYGEGRINEALHAGGPELVAQTLESITGIRIDYWVLVGFEDFVNIVDFLGGVKIDVPTDVYDPIGSGAKIPAGTQNLGAEEALSYVRTRKAFADGDIQRTTNQARFLIAMLHKLRRQVENSPTALFRWTAAARRYARFDLTAPEMFRLGVLASQVDPADVGNVTVPVSYGSVGAASVVFISSEAADVYEEFRETGALSPP